MKRRGVSLLEMSVVIALTTILATGVVVVVDEIKKEARRTKLARDLHDLNILFGIPTDLHRAWEAKKLPTGLHSLHDDADRLLTSFTPHQKSILGTPRRLTASETAFLQEHGVSDIMVVDSVRGTSRKVGLDPASPPTLPVIIYMDENDDKWEAVVLGVGKGTRRSGEFIRDVPTADAPDGYYNNYLAVIPIRQLPDEAADAFSSGDDSSTQSSLLYEPGVAGYVSPVPSNDPRGGERCIRVLKPNGETIKIPIKD